MYALVIAKVLYILINLKIPFKYLIKEPVAFYVA